MKFLYQKLIYDYKLNITGMPDELYKAVIGFPKSIVTAEKTKEGRKLLKEADDKLAIGIYSWLISNQDDLSELICTDCRFKELYGIFWDAFIKCDYQESEFIANKRVTVKFRGKTPFGECAYFEFAINHVDSSELFMLEICEYNKTLTPKYLYVYNKEGKQDEVRSIVPNDGKSEGAADKRLAHNFFLTLTWLLDKNIVFACPAMTIDKKIKKFQNLLLN